MSEDKKVYAGADEFLFFVGESPESAIEALCSGDDLKEIPEQNDLQMPDKILTDYIRNLAGISPCVPNEVARNSLNYS